MKSRLTIPESWAQLYVLPQGQVMLFLSSSYPGAFLCPISDTYLGFPRTWELCTGWLDHRSHLKYMQIISSKQWYKKCQDLCHIHGDQWHAWTLDIFAKEVDAPLQHLHLQNGGSWFSASSVPLKFCEGLTARSHGKVSPLIWDRNCMKLFSCVGKTELCNPRWEGPKLCLWGEKRGGESHRKHR